MYTKKKYSFISNSNLTGFSGFLFAKPHHFFQSPKIFDMEQDSGV